MADSEIIKKSDLIEAGAIKDALQDPMLHFVGILDAKVQPAILKLADSLGKTLKEFQKGLSAGDIDIKGLKGLNEEIKKANELSIASEKVNKAKAQTAIALEKQKQEEIKTTIAEIAVDQKKQKSDEKQIFLSDKEIAQSQIEKQNAKDRITSLKAEIVEMDKTVGTLQRVEAANTRLRLERKKLDTETAAGAARLKQINAELDRNNKYIVENSDKLKQQKLNVGNYAESIKKAFEGTGALGDQMNKYLNVITTLASKIESFVAAIVAQTAAKKAATAAEKANTSAVEGNVIATEAATAANKTNTASLETQIATTEAANVATQGLGASLLKLAKNPYVIAAVAVAALVKVVYDSVVATQAQKDAFDAAFDATSAVGNTTIAASIGYNKLYKETVRLYLAEKKLQDLRISNITRTQELKAEAAEARAAAAEAGVTTAQKIIFLQEYIDKAKLANNLDQSELLNNLKIKQGYVTLYGKFATREQKEQLEQAKAALDKDRQEDATETLRAQKQQTALIERYNDEILKMRQDAQKLEIDLIDTFSKYKAEQLTKQLAKDLQLNQIETNQAVENLKKKQKELGAVDASGVDHTAEFERAISALQNTGAAKAIQLRKKTNEEIDKLNEDFHQKQLESERKFQDDMRKLDESYVKLVGSLDKQQQDNELQRNQSEIDRQQNEISDLRDKRNLEITEGKKTRQLTLADLKIYFDAIDVLQKEHYDLSKKRITDDADFNKYVEQNKTDNAIQAIKDRYAKIKAEDEKAISNKTKDPEERKKQIESNAAELARKEAEEILKVQRDLASQIALIDEKLKGDLSKADEDELKRQRAVLKQKQDINNQELADKKAANKELLSEVKRATNEITSGIQQGLQKRSELQQQADQKDIDYHNRIIEVQAKLAAAGQDNILAEEQARADKAEEKKLQDAKKAAKIQENITIIKTFADTLTAALESNKPFLRAFAEATAASGLVAAAFAKLFSGSAYEGTEDTGPGGKIDNKGGMAWIVHPRERILTAEQNKKVGKLTNEELVSRVVSSEQNKVNEKNKTNVKNISNDKSSVKEKSTETIRISEKQLTGIVQNLFNESVLNKENISNEKTKTNESSKSKIVDIIVNNFKNVYSHDKTTHYAESTTDYKTNMDSIKNTTNAVHDSVSEKEKHTAVSQEKLKSSESVNVTAENIYNTFSTVAKLFTDSGTAPASETKNNTSKEVTNNISKELRESNSAFESIYTPQFQSTNVSTTQVKENSHDAVMTQVLRNEIRELKKTIEGKPVQQVNLSALGEVTEKIIQKGITHIIHHKKQDKKRSLRLNG